MTPAQAQDNAKDVLSKIRFGNDDYVFGYDFQGINIFSPKIESAARSRRKIG